MSGLRVVAAASRVRLTPEGTGDPRAVTVTVSAPPPARHHNLFAVGEDLWPAEVEDSGFLLSDGTYADRSRAAEVAITAGQIEKLAHPPHLYSEDLW